MGECEVVLGIDACPGGWVAVELRDGLFAGASIATGLRSLLRGPATGPGGVVAVDMPLGLLDTGWRRLSRQSWGLAAKLREANDCLADTGGERLFEVHPEVSFWALNDRTPLPHRKKSWSGQMTRRSLLAAAGIVLPDDLGEAGRAQPDDVLDAAAAAWSAHRIAQGRAGCLPDPPQCDERGRPIAIWY
ncbi:DUF429 domain-containing protein [Streptomyces sp. NPDC091376]|uniref:DUF429 domain-containing protein n=1 Tax=Streptomyces sp. NPDC091376 TaxID=3365994 RepID=UPI003815E000